jgi:hypothetical protein
MSRSRKPKRNRASQPVANTPDGHPNDAALSPWNHPTVVSLCIGTVGLIVAITTAAASIWYNHSQSGRAAETLDLTKRSQRAWIGVEDISIDGFGSNRTFDAKVNVKNTGGTPATIVDYGGLFFAVAPNEHLPDQRSAHEGLQMRESMQVSIPPSGTGTLNIPSNKPADEKLVDQIVHGKKVLQCVGNVTYKDVDGSLHHTQWCYYLDNSSKNLIRDLLNNRMD